MYCYIMYVDQKSKFFKFRTSMDFIGYVFLPPLQHVLHCSKWKINLKWSCCNYEFPICKYCSYQHPSHNYDCGSSDISDVALNHEEVAEKAAKVCVLITLNADKCTDYV